MYASEFVEGDAVYFDGSTSRRREVRLRLAGALELHEGETLAASWPYASIRRADGGPGVTRLSSRAAAELARIDIADPALALAVLAHCENLGGDGAAGNGPVWRIVGWSVAAAVSITLIALYGVPAIARQLAPLIPFSLEARVGDAVANQVDAIFSGGACDDPAGQAAMAKLTDELKSKAALPGDVSLKVRHSRVANAFAIPGGRVYVLSALIDKADTPDELAGVIAHEFGHVAHRDGLKGMIASGGTAFLFGLLLGDVTGSGAILFASRTLLNAAHSRQDEAAADAFAAKTMLALGRSPAPLGNFLLRMTGAQSGGAIALLASHPLSQDRLAELQRQDQPETGPPLLDDTEWKALKGICGGR